MARFKTGTTTAVETTGGADQGRSANSVTVDREGAIAIAAGDAAVMEGGKQRI